MTKKEFKKVIEELTEHRKGVSEDKAEDYTLGNQDCLYNFKSVAERTGQTPLQVWQVYFLKHIDAICNYCKTGGQSESEPIKERFSDALNYLELGWGLIQEEERQDEFEHAYDAVKYQVPSFCDTPNACHHDGCMCERTDKFVEDEKTEYNVENIWYNRLNESYFITFHNGYGLSLHGKKIVSVETNEVNSLCQLETKDKRYIVEDEQG